MEEMRKTWKVFRTVVWALMTHTTSGGPDVSHFFWGWCKFSHTHSAAIWAGPSLYKRMLSTSPTSCQYPAPAVVTKMSRDIVNVPWGTKVSLVENHWNDLNWIAGLKNNFFICISTLFYLESEMQGWIVPTQPEGPSAGRRGLYPTGPKREELCHHSAVNTATGGGWMPGGTAGESNGPWAVGQRGAGMWKKQPKTDQEEP